MLVETCGVRIYTPGRGNFEAAKQESKHSVARRRKAETLAMSTGNLRRCFRRFVGRNRKSRRRVGRSGEELPERWAQRKSGKERKECPSSGTSEGTPGGRNGPDRRAHSSSYWKLRMIGPCATGCSAAIPT